MNPDRRRLARLHRLERIRTIARQTAAAQAAEAEGTLAQLAGLAERTRLLAAEYGNRAAARDGASLAEQGRFVAGLASLHGRTAQDATRARDLADARQAELATAERRRAAVENRAVRLTREQRKQGGERIHGPRRELGTDLD